MFVGIFHFKSSLGSSEILTKSLLKCRFIWSNVSELSVFSVSVLVYHWVSVLPEGGDFGGIWLDFMEKTHRKLKWLAQFVKKLQDKLYEFAQLQSRHCEFLKGLLCYQNSCCHALSVFLSFLSQTFPWTHPAALKSCNSKSQSSSGPRGIVFLFFNIIHL